MTFKMNDSVLEQSAYLLSSKNNTTNLSCPVWTPDDIELVESFKYWVGGVAVCCLALPGMILNLIAIYVLISRSTIHTTFNSLLVSLFAVDSIYLFFETIETFRERFHLETRLHTILLPNFTYPLTFISLSASIFMTVGVAHERYDAIKKPILHRQSMTSAKFRRKKFVIYILIVCLFAIGFNIPKFFEVELKWVNDKDRLSNGTDYR